MTKRVLALLLSMVLLLTMLPATALAVGPEDYYGLNLTGLDFTKWNLDTTCSGNGWSWDNSGNKKELTLNGFDQDLNNGIKVPAGTTIILEGTNSLEAEAFGINSNGAITFKGDGDLTITVAENIATIYTSYGIDVGNNTVTFSGSGEITISAASYYKGAATGIGVRASRIVRGADTYPKVTIYGNDQAVSFESLYTRFGQTWIPNLPDNSQARDDRHGSLWFYLYQYPNPNINLSDYEYVRFLFEAPTVNYTVKYFFEQTVDAGDYVCDEGKTVETSGVEGTTVYVADYDNTYDGYTYKEAKYNGTPVTEVTLATGTTEIVLELYYDNVSQTPIDPELPVFIRYIVEHYKENAEGTYVLAETEYLTGEAGDEVEATPKTCDDHAFNENHEGSVLTGILVVPDEPTDIVILKLYYDLVRQTPIDPDEIPVSIRYMVEHYLEQDDGTYKLDATEILAGVSGDVVNATPKAYEGYTLNEGYTGNVLTGTLVIPDEPTDLVILKLHYDKDEPQDNGIPQYDPLLRHIEGNLFLMSKPVAPTEVLLDGEPVPFDVDGCDLTINAILSEGNHSVTAIWNGSRATVWFRASAIEIIVDPPKTGDSVSFGLIAGLAVLAVAGAGFALLLRKRDNI